MAPLATSEDVGLSEAGCQYLKVLRAVTVVYHHHRAVWHFAAVGVGHPPASVKEKSALPRLPAVAREYRR